MGKEVVAKCCGVPLVIKTIGGMLYFKDLESEWLLFKDTELSKIDVFNNDILPILKLSYNHLPSHYKHCFAYCSLYPKDFEFPVEDLILQWKAHGYLKATCSNECVRDIGFRYFMDLFRLSFFQDVERDDYGNIEYCKMHDLMHDLAISVAGDLFSVSRSREIIKDKTHHLSFWIDQFSTPHDFSSMMEARKMRTLLPLFKMKFPMSSEDLLHFKKRELDTLFCNLKSLRVLSLPSMSVGRVPSSISRLKHLRYLNLSCSYSVKRLPHSITNLRNLQVLMLQWCLLLGQLPNNISKLVNLTNLDNYHCDSLTCMPRGIGQLTRLEKLSTFVISKHHSILKHSSGGFDELHALNNLRGELTIKNLRYTSDFKAADLSSKQQLERLILFWNESDDEDDKCSKSDVAKDEKGLEMLRPHQNLKDLSVEYYRGAKPPSWLPSLGNLVLVSFFCCRNVQWLPSFDGFPCLKKLTVRRLASLEYIDIEKGGSSPFFPSLTTLCLIDCPNLKGFLKPTENENLPCFPCLSKLEIGGCPNLTYLPLFLELKYLLLKDSGLKTLMEILKTASQSTSSPFSILSRLQLLEITNMDDSLEDELLECLPSLERLSFVSCSFNTVDSDKDDGMKWRSLKVLRSVEFYLMPNLVSLPKGLQYVPTLQRLYMWKCTSLVCMPDWMSNLVTLQDLTIDSCTQLEERCNNNTAEDWPKISHIPNITVDFKQIQRNGCYLL